MKIVRLPLLVSIFLFAGCGQNINPTTTVNTIATKPVIVLVAFGTSVPRARNVFDSIELAAKKRYPTHDVRWAFTSSFIRKKLAKQGVITKSPEEVLAELKDGGVTQAVFQSLHIAPGQEYREVSTLDTTGLDIVVGKALLSSDADIAAALDAIAGDIQPQAANVLAFHGNDRYPKFNEQIVKTVARAEARFKNTWGCSVEGQPGTASLSKAKSVAAKLGRVHFIPMMIVAGDHVMNDVMGDEPDSWAQIVRAPQSTCAKPLGYNAAILEIYFQHIDHALTEWSQPERRSAP